MTRLNIASVLALALAVFVAWRLGGALGGGVLAGTLLGTGLSGLGALYMRHMLVTRPEQFMAALLVSFLTKLVALFLGALAFRYIEAAGQRIDWRSFSVAFAATSCIVLPIGALDASRVLKRRVSAVAGSGAKGLEI